MVDKAPLIFEAKLGMLAPANRIAEEAMSEIKGRVMVEIKGGVANQRRRGLYWIIAAIVTGLLCDKHGLTIDDQDLHDITREKLRLYDEVRLPSGEVHHKLKSTSNRAMNEAARAEYTNKAFALWSRWVGVDIATLTQEAERIAL